MELARPTDDALRARLLRGRGTAQLSLARFEEAVDDWRSAIELFESAEDWDVVTELAIESAMPLGWLTRADEMAAVSGRALEKVSADATQRIRLLGSHGMALGQAGEFDTGDAATSEAVALAEQLNDPGLLAEALFMKGMNLWLNAFKQRAADVFDRASQAATTANKPWLHLEAVAVRQFCLVHLGRLEESSRLGAEIEPSADRLGHFSAQLHGALANATVEWLTSTDIDSVDAGVRAADSLLAGTGYAIFSEIWKSRLSFFRGDWEGARDRVAAAEEIWHIGDGGAGWARHFLYECYLGNATAAESLLAASDHEIPRSGGPAGLGRWEMLFAAVEGSSLIGAKPFAAELYPAIRAALDHGNVLSHLGDRLIETVAGIAAAAGENWETAEGHFQRALQEAEKIPFRTEQADARRFYAAMLLDRGSSADRQRASALLAQATAIYREAGMERHLRLVRSGP